MPHKSPAVEQRSLSHRLAPDYPQRGSERRLVGGAGGLRSTLAALAAGCGSGARFISADLVADPSIKSGYVLALAESVSRAEVATDCNGTVKSRSGYYATAVPVLVGRSGQRAYSTGKAYTIYVAMSGVPPPDGGVTAIPYRGSGLRARAPGSALGGGR
jgi:hypothetical protein